MATEANITRASYIFMALTALTVAVFHLGTPLLAILFSVLTLNLFSKFTKKWVAVGIYTCLLLIILFSVISFSKDFIKELPEIAEKSIPAVIDHANRYGLDLPFSDLDSLKTTAIGKVRNEVAYIAKFAGVATREFVYFIIGAVVAIGIFLNSKLDLDSGNYTIPHNVYSVFCHELAERFKTLYKSFATVIGAQLIISLVNTTATAIFILATFLPFFKTLVVITFLCGLLPVIGNIISNTIIFSIALTISPNLAIASLVFLVALHKAEYFLNSKIIGGRIRNPMWLTLTGLVLGETLMGIPGIILAPVILRYIKLECSKIPVN